VRHFRGEDLINVEIQEEGKRKDINHEIVRGIKEKKHEVYDSGVTKEKAIIRRTER